MKCPHCDRELVLGLVTWDCSDHGPIQDVECLRHAHPAYLDPEHMCTCYPGDFPNIRKVVAVLPIPQEQIDEFFHNLTVQTLFGEDSQEHEYNECCQGGDINPNCDGCPNGPY